MKRYILILLVLISLSFSQGDGSKGSLRFVELEGKKQFYVDIGTGDPAIVLLTGLGVPMDDFSDLQARLSKTNRTIAYDRAGIGKSEAIANERSLDNLAGELNSILSKIDITEPFILVGHSRGGLLARYFASQYPGKVLGLVLIDPTIPELRWKKRALRTAEEKIQYDAFYKAFYADSSSYPPTVKSEFKSLYTSDSILMADKSFPRKIPVTVIASVKTTREKYSKEDNEIKISLLSEYVKSAQQIKLVLTRKAGHFIHNDQPGLVTGEIRAMAAAIKSATQR